MIQRETHGDITVLRLQHGKANAFDLELLQRLEQSLGEIEGATVLTGTASMFSAGVDLFRILDGGPDYLEQFIGALIGAFDRLFFAEYPIVAAINGHAIAGGCILACGCDHRVVSDGKVKLGVTELSVGVPFPALALEILRAALAPHVVHDLVFTRRLVGPAEAAKLGLVDRVVPAERCLDEALAAAESLAAIPAAAFAVTKRQLRAPVRAVLDGVLADHDAQVREGWASAEAREQMQRFVDANVGKAKRS